MIVADDLAARIAAINARAFSAAARSARLAKFAEDRFAVAVRAGKIDPHARRFVDGREGAPESAVRPGGRIVYLSNMVPDAVAWLLGFLIGRSPPASSAPINPKTGKSGHFRDSFFVGVNGAFIPADRFEPSSVPPNAEVIIGNSEPYNRRVDVQTAGSRTLRFSVPPGIWADAVFAARDRYPGLAIKRVDRVTFPGQYHLHHEQRRAGARAHSVQRAVGGLVDSPGIVISPL